MANGNGIKLWHFVVVVAVIFATVVASFTANTLKGQQNEKENGKTVRMVQEIKGESRQAINKIDIGGTRESHQNKTNIAVIDNSLREFKIEVKDDIGEVKDDIKTFRTEQKVRHTELLHAIREK